MFKADSQLCSPENELGLLFASATAVAQSRLSAASPGASCELSVGPGGCEVWDGFPFNFFQWQYASRLLRSRAFAVGSAAFPDCVAQGISPLRIPLFGDIRSCQGMKLDVFRFAYEEGNDLLRLVLLDFIAPGNTAVVVASMSINTMS